MRNDGIFGTVIIVVALVLVAFWCFDHTIAVLQDAVEERDRKIQEMIDFADDPNAMLLHWENRTFTKEVK